MVSRLSAALTDSAVYLFTSISRARELSKFAAVGSLSVAINLLVITALTEGLRINYRLSIAVCFCTVTLISFCLNRMWTFGKGERALVGDLLRYVLVTLTQLLVCVAACSFLVGRLHVPYQVSVVLLSIIFVPVNYIFHRAWSFQLRWSRDNS